MEKEKNRIIKHKVTHQGGVIVDFCYIYEEAENIVAIAIQTKTKYCELEYTGGGKYPCIGLIGNECSLHVRSNKKFDDITEIEFPEYEKWDVWSTQGGKYTTSMCLVKMTDNK